MIVMMIIMTRRWSKIGSRWLVVGVGLHTYRVAILQTVIVERCSSHHTLPFISRCVTQRYGRLALWGACVSGVGCYRSATALGISRYGIQAFQQCLLGLVQPMLADPRHGQVVVPCGSSGSSSGCRHPHDLDTEVAARKERFLVFRSLVVVVVVVLVLVEKSLVVLCCCRFCS